MTHTCIKPGCGATYQDNDPDPYYCDSCKAHNKEMAARVDSIVAARPRKPRMSLLQEYDAAQKVRGFVRASL